MNKYQVEDGQVKTNLTRRQLLLIRQSEATERQAERNARSNQEQVTILDRRLGAGLGATKERARLTEV